MHRLLFVITAVVIAGCASGGLSKESMALADRSVPYSALREDPERLSGTYLLLGGMIASVRNTPDGSELEIVQLPLGTRGRPAPEEPSEGRFLAVTTQFLDPLIFKAGTRVSLVGKVAGKKVLPLEGMNYPYPLVQIKELHLWPPDQEREGPRVEFGFGFFHGF